jgi:hypothetical protein
MPDAGAWYGTVSDGSGSGRLGGGPTTYRIGTPRRTSDKRALAKRYAKTKAKRRTVKRARRANRG